MHFSLTSDDCGPPLSVYIKGASSLLEKSMSHEDIHILNEFEQLFTYEVPIHKQKVILFSHKKEKKSTESSLSKVQKLC